MLEFLGRKMAYEMSKEERRIAKLLRNKLKDGFPDFSEHHRVLTRNVEGGFSVSYNLTRPSLERGKVSGISLQTRGDVGYVLFISIEGERRNNGLGGKLLEITEDFLRGMNVREIRLTPSGHYTNEEGERKPKEEWFAKRGYEDFKDSEVKKILV